MKFRCNSTVSIRVLCQAEVVCLIAGTEMGPQYIQSVVPSTHKPFSYMAGGYVCWSTCLLVCSSWAQLLANHSALLSVAFFVSYRTAGLDPCLGV